MFGSVCLHRENFPGNNNVFSLVEGVRLPMSESLGHRKLCQVSFKVTKTLKSVITYCVEFRRDREGSIGGWSPFVVLGSILLTDCNAMRFF